MSSTVSFTGEGPFASIAEVANHSLIFTKKWVEWGCFLILRIISSTVPTIYTIISSLYLSED